MSPASPVESIARLRAAALYALALADPWEKARAVLALGPDSPGLTTAPTTLPGRLDRPVLVAPAQLTQRSVGTREGHAALVHSLCHIELNAVNLALDIAQRFDAMPQAFYTDWIGVAREEARHFMLLAEHLRTLGHAYGDFPAHNGLWEMAERTCDDLLARLVMVPMLLEARGLDVSPPIRAKLWSIGDRAGAAILDIILRDEVGHVAIGLNWYRWLCTERGLEALATVEELRARYGAPPQRGPLNLEARRKAGFTEPELARLAPSR
jgi:uncharacterized ferritin-like protein (DUF455 family)